MGTERRVPTIEILVTICGYPGASVLTEINPEMEIASPAIKTTCRVALCRLDATPFSWLSWSDLRNETIVDFRRGEITNDSSSSSSTAESQKPKDNWQRAMFGEAWLQQRLA